MKNPEERCKKYIEEYKHLAKPYDLHIHHSDKFHITRVWLTKGDSQIIITYMLGNHYMDSTASIEGAITRAKREFDNYWNGEKPNCMVIL